MPSSRTPSRKHARPLAPSSLRALRAVALLGLLACGDATGNPAPAEGAFAELYAQGVDRYLGAFLPTSSEPARGGVTVHEFLDEDGPRCFTGNEFRTLTRQGSSDTLMIFLQGGGACGETNCDAVDQAPPLLPPLGILDAGDADNPARSFDVGYVPYCDGTLFMGDADDDSEVDRSFRGVMNLSAALDVIADTFPAPERILLIGNSAGGFGVHAALPLVRQLYPDVAIALVNDSGPGISAPGNQERLNAYWNAGSFFPASCTDCIGEDGHLTGWHLYQLGEDPNVRMGFLSTRQDSRIADEGLGIGGDAYEAALLPAMAELEAAFPDRFRSLIASGDGHTFVLRDFDRAVGGTSVRQWITDLLSGEDDWVSVRE